MSMKKYWLDPKISWKTYKLIHDKLAVPDSGPTPKNFNKVLWQMLKERKLNIYITDKPIDDDTWFPTIKNIPKKATLLSNPSLRKKATGSSLQLL